MPFFNPSPERLLRKRDFGGLIKLLGSRDIGIQKQVKRYLSQSDMRQEAVPYLIEALSNSAVSSEAEALLSSEAEALRFSSILGETIDSLVTVLMSTDLQTRRYAAAVLSKMPVRRYTNIQPLIDAALHSDLFLRRHAVKALRDCRYPRASEAFSANLNDPNVGYCAAVALGEMGDPNAVRPLAQALANGCGVVSVIRALRDIGNEPALAAILDYAKSNPTRLKGEVEVALMGAIPAFHMEPATDFLIEQGRWTDLWPSHKQLVISSSDRCRRLSDTIARWISSGKGYMRSEYYEFLATILREHGAAVEDEIIMMIVGLRPTKEGWAEEGYEEVEAAGYRAQRAALANLLEVAKAEQGRRKLK